MIGADAMSSRDQLFHELASFAKEVASQPYLEWAEESTHEAFTTVARTLVVRYTALQVSETDPPKEG